MAAPLVRERSGVQSSLAAPLTPSEIKRFSLDANSVPRQEQAERTEKTRSDTGKIRGLSFSARSRKPLQKCEAPAQTETPTTAATEAGANTQQGSKKPGTYQGRIARAIISFRVGPDLLIQSFAFAEVLA